jgi:putative glutamine amidotransferase
MASKQQPIVGITCGRIEPAHSHHPSRVGQNQTYVDALVRAGASPLLLPNLEDQALLRILYDKLDGLLLSGGGDIEPARYGETVHEKCGHIDLERDEAELTLTRWAVEDGKPLLAICRGIQILNVALGGSLYQDIEAQVADPLVHTWYPEHPRNHRSHTVSIAPKTRLAQVFDLEPLPVNSLHHQALKDLAPPLTVSARASDRVVEAVELGSHPFVLGVQWHPEDLAPDDVQQQGLFDSFVQACQY